jgi:hypothetical protein
MTDMMLTNAVTRWAHVQHDAGNRNYLTQQLHVLADARDDCDSIELAAAVAQLQADVTYSMKVLDGIDDASRYLDTMVQEWDQQTQANYELADDESNLDDIVRYRMFAERAEARKAAYEDALRVIDIAFQVALKAVDE